MAKFGRGKGGIMEWIKVCTSEMCVYQTRLSLCSMQRQRKRRKCVYSQWLIFWLVSGLFCDFQDVVTLTIR